LEEFASLKKLQIKIGIKLYRYRSFTPILVIFTVLLFSRPGSFFNKYLQKELLDYTGFAFAITGQVIRIITLGFTKKKTSGRGRVIKAFSLNTDGLYSFTRNPLYLGNLFITIGLTIIYNSLFCYVVVISFWVFQYWHIIIAEEDFLKKKFGQLYSNYSLKVPRLFPKISRELIFLPKDKKFNWRYVIEREYNALLSWVMFAIVLKIYGDIYTLGYSHFKPEIPFWIACMALLILLFSFFKAWRKGLIGNSD